MNFPEELTPEFLDKLAECACKHYTESLPKQGKPLSEKREWTTFASIIQTDGSNAMKVVAFGTGTKCLGQNELSANGDLVSDSHGEVLARRSFCLYLYDQINQFMYQNPSILEPYKNEEGHDLFEICPDLKFHLFISHIPCGDAAIFGINNEKPEESETVDVPSKKMKLDVNRTGAKLSERQYEDIQCIGKCRIKPGKGDPTLSMSCSDKIAKWQILGLQGSLLSNFIPKPINLSSVIVGSSVNFSAEALQRAVHSRFHFELTEDLQATHLPPVFHQSHTNFMAFPEDGKPAPASISGFSTAGSFLIEVSVNGRKQGATKKNFGKPAARVRVCRKNMLQKFVQLVQKFEAEGLVLPFKSSSNWTYAAAKKLNVNYVKRWVYLKKEIMLGWTDKPDHLQDFTAND